MTQSTHRVIDLLPDRTAATFATWLHGRPEPAIISRDRGGEYADGARQGAPHALQVADRFHLVMNVTDAFERFLIRKHAALRKAACTASTAAESTPTRTTDGRADEPVAAPPLNRLQREQQERRARRYARYEELCALRAQGRAYSFSGESPTAARASAGCAA